MEAINIDIGENVWCDFCGEDWTERNETGGFLFGSKATCPECADRMMPNIIKYGEESFIKAKCPPELSFRDWVYTLRE